MNKMQRIADTDMRYLARAWRAGYDGPLQHPKGTSVWQQIIHQIRRAPYRFDEDRVESLYQRWVRVADADRYAAAILVLHYREGHKPGDCTFSDDALGAALERFYLA